MTNSFFYKQIVYLLFIIFIVSCNNTDNNISYNNISNDLNILLRSSKTNQQINVKNIIKNKDYSFINFWSIHCPSCIRELSSINKMYNKRHNKMNVILISLDQLKDIKDIVAKYDFDAYTAVTKISDNIMPDVIPYSFIINKEKKILFIESGYRDWNTKESNYLIDSICK